MTFGRITRSDLSYGFLSIKVMQPTTEFSLNTTSGLHDFDDSQLAK